MLFLDRHAAGLQVLARPRFLHADGGPAIRLDGNAAWAILPEAVGSYRAGSYAGGVLFLGGAGSVEAYPLTTAGVGAKMDEVTGLPAFLGFNRSHIEVAASGTVVAVCNGDGYAAGVPWDGSDFGTPMVAPVAATAMRLFPTGDMVLLRIGLVAQIRGWDDVTGFGAVLPAGATGGGFGGAPQTAIDVTAGAFLCLSGTSLRMAFEVDPVGGVGAAYTLPASLTGLLVRAVRFSPAGNRLAVLSAWPNALRVYEWDDTTGFGAEVVAAVPPVGSITTSVIEWAPAGDAIFVSRAALGAGDSLAVVAYPYGATLGAPVVATTLSDGVEYLIVGAF